MYIDVFPVRRFLPAGFFCVLGFCVCVEAMKKAAAGVILIPDKKQT